MSDKTIPAKSDDYKKQKPEDDSAQDRKVENDPLVEEAKSHTGEPPNRDEDEFTGRGQKAPDVDVHIKHEVEESENS